MLKFQTATVGIISTASLIVGVAAAAATSKGDAILAGSIGAISGSLSVVVGESLALSRRYTSADTKESFEKTCHENRNSLTSPLLLALSYAPSFVVGAVAPIAIAILAPKEYLVASVFIVSLVVLSTFGASDSSSNGPGLWHRMVVSCLLGAGVMVTAMLVGTAFNLVL
ncbi:VIT1/CCC1 transporter family protein [Sedimentitalea nanhaiensis]|uniref:VIT1/CCC1 transporter family protein n=1 Tax=Sedimentitalea nanhaiensis TaxID=999627 RepID=UPI00349F0271